MPTGFQRFKPLARLFTRSLAVVAVGAGLLLQTHAPAEAQSNPRYAAFVIDANNGKVLFNRYGDDPRFPASLTKMMTLYMMFEALETGRARRDTPMNVSAFAAGRPPSKLGLRAGSTITVDEAMHSLVTRSANDAATVIGEFLGGTETRFAEMMTQKARSLGMSRTTFRNAHGLPDPQQRTTARDMATLSIALREHFPQYYKIFSTRSYTFRGQTIGNHNRVLGRLQGVDGIKTGYINASGFNLASSVVRGNKKLVAVVMGGRTARTRDDHMVELLQQYIPQASERAGGPLLASWSPSNAPRVTAAAQVASVLPSNVPVPTLRAAGASIDERVASAYGSTAAGAMEDALRSPSGRPLVGRDALRAALAAQSDRPAPTPMDIPTANALVPASNRPVPRAVIPSAPIDPRPTGSIERAEEPSAEVEVASLDTPDLPSRAASPWVVQIAATPLEATALDMLAEAKRQVGSALSSAKAYTETVDAGSQTLYRARFAGFETRGDANAACEALKRSSYACYAVSTN